MNMTEFRNQLNAMADYALEQSDIAASAGAADLSDRLLEVSQLSDTLLRKLFALSADAGELDVLWRALSPPRC